LCVRAAANSAQAAGEKEAANSYGNELQEARLHGHGQQVRLGSGLNSRPAAGSAGLGALLPWAPRLLLLTTAVEYHAQYNNLNFLGVVRRPETAVPVQVHINACQNIAW